MAANAILLSSKPSSLLLLRQNPNPNPRLLPPLSTSFPLKPSVKHPLLSSSSSRFKPSVAVSASLLPTPPPPPPRPPSPFLSIITGTIAAILSLASSFFRSIISLASSFAQAFFSHLTPGSLRLGMIRMAGALVIALDVYQLMLLTRHHYPGLPWNHQPLMKIRGICDPFLNLSRQVFPSMFGNSDLSAHLGIHLLAAVNLVLYYAWRSIVR